MRSLHRNGNVLRLSSLPHEEKHLLDRPLSLLRCSASAFSNPRRAVS
jgi:hypothetical protein